MMIPPTFCSPSSRRSTITRSCRGRIFTVVFVAVAIAFVTPLSVGLGFPASLKTSEDEVPDVAPLRAGNPDDRLLILWKASGAVKQSIGRECQVRGARPRGPGCVRVGSGRSRVLGSSDRRSSGASSDPVLRHFPGHGVAVHAEHFGGAAEVALGPLEGARDEHLLELAPGIVVEHALVEHFRHELLQLIAHGLGQLAVREAAERFHVLVARALDHLIRQRRDRRLLVPPDLFQVVAHVLLVEAGLSLPGCTDPGARSARSRASALRRSAPRRWRDRRRRPGRTRTSCRR